MPTNRAAVLIGLFGGVSRLSEMTSIDKAVISRWHTMIGPRAGMGDVPAQYNSTLLEAAGRAGIHRRKIMACLQLSCPSCGQKLTAESMHTLAQCGG